MRFVLDACALIAYFKAEPGEDIIRGLINRAATRDDALFMSVYNLLEICYGFYREIGAEKTAALKRNIYRLPITVIDYISVPVFDEALRLKAAYRCSLADAVGIAVAVELSAQFVTSDHHELEEIAEKERIPFLWLPPRPKK
jgi:predicted nucleic acid-binding protein